MPSVAAASAARARPLRQPGWEKANAASSTPFACAPRSHMRAISVHACPRRLRGTRGRARVRHDRNPASRGARHRRRPRLPRDHRHRRSGRGRRAVASHLFHHSQQRDQQRAGLARVRLRRGMGQDHHRRLRLRHQRRLHQLAFRRRRQRQRLAESGIHLEIPRLRQSRARVHDLGRAGAPVRRNGLRGGGRSRRQHHADALFRQGPRRPAHRPLAAARDHGRAAISDLRLAQQQAEPMGGRRLAAIFHSVPAAARQGHGPAGFHPRA